jgi:hypothetical protein
VFRAQKAFCFDAARRTRFSVCLKLKDIDSANLKMFKMWDNIFENKFFGKSRRDFWINRQLD